MRYYQHWVWRTGTVAVILILGAGSTGCAENKYADLKAFLPAKDHDVSSTTYRIEVPDSLSITSPTCPEIDGVTQRIRQDGKISLQLLGDVKVTELTPKELSAKIEGLLSRYYVSPKVVVEVSSYESKKIYVFGQVNGEGARPFTGRDTVLDVLAEARPTFIAWGSRVKLIRPSASEDERRELTVDIDKIMQTGDLKQNLLLQEGDIVYVPPTPLGWVGLRIYELLFPFGPMQSAYTMPASFMWSTEYYTERDRHGGGNVRRP